MSIQPGFVIGAACRLTAAPPSLQLKPASPVMRPRHGAGAATCADANARPFAVGAEADAT